jgi:hypothetical protein
MKAEGLLLCSKQRQMILIHIHPSCMCEVKCTINVTAASTSTASFLFPEGYPTKILYAFFYLYHADCVSHPFLFVHPIFNDWNTTLCRSNCIPSPVAFPSHFQRLFSESYSQTPPTDLLPVM